MGSGIRVGRKKGRGEIEVRRGRNRIEIEPIDRAEGWGCDKAGEKEIGKGKGENQLLFRQQLMLAQPHWPQQLWRALQAFLFCCCPQGLRCSASQLDQQVFILHLFS